METQSGALGLPVTHHSSDSSPRRGWGGAGVAGEGQEWPGAGEEQERMEGGTQDVKRT